MPHPVVHLQLVVMYTKNTRIKMQKDLQENRMQLKHNQRNQHLKYYF